MNTNCIMKGGESVMKKFNIVKVAGFVLPLVGAGLTLLTGIVEDKKLDDKIAEKVSEAIANAKE